MIKGEYVRDQVWKAAAIGTAIASIVIANAADVSAQVTLLGIGLLSPAVIPLGKEEQ